MFTKKLFLFLILFSQIKSSLITEMVSLSTNDHSTKEVLNEFVLDLNKKIDNFNKLKNIKIKFVKNDEYCINLSKKIFTDLKSALSASSTAFRLSKPLNLYEILKNSKLSLNEESSDLNRSVYSLSLKLNLSNTVLLSNMDLLSIVLLKQGSINRENFLYLKLGKISINKKDNFNADELLAGLYTDFNKFIISKKNIKFIKFNEVISISSGLNGRYYSKWQAAC